MCVEVNVYEFKYKGTLAKKTTAGALVKLCKMCVIMCTSDKYLYTDFCIQCNVSASAVRWKEKKKGRKRTQSANELNTPPETVSQTVQKNLYSVKRLEMSITRCSPSSRVCGYARSENPRLLPKPHHTPSSIWIYAIYCISLTLIGVICSPTCKACRTVLAHIPKHRAINITNLLDLQTCQEPTRI